MVRVMAGGSVRADFARTVGARSTAIGASVTVPGCTYALGETLLVKARVSGTAPADLRLKVWKQGSPEPTGWTVQRSDSTSALQGPDAIGFHSYLSGASTNAPVQARHDDLTATPLP